MKTSSSRLGLFEAVGIELEYMIVDSASMDIRAITDELIHRECGAYESHVERGELAWSNELALHVIELKTNGPVGDPADALRSFQSEIEYVNGCLKPWNARLMPGAMHPWMNPLTETRLWPHDYNVVYEAFNRVFDCRGHGWSNLQSCHLNLPFATDEEFFRLHSAIRLVMPILPALAASSPFMDGKTTGQLDSRLQVYRRNCARIPSVTGKVIPEAVDSEAAYRTHILEPMYRDIEPFDPDHTLRDEWLNARGAIARFERGTVEIRVLDVQECPLADLTIAALVQAALKALVQERWTDFEFQQRFSTAALETIFLDTVCQAEAATITDPEYLALFGFSKFNAVTATDIWTKISENTLLPDMEETSPVAKSLQTLLSRGSLARRILKHTGATPTHCELREVYEQLCDCLARGRMFE